MKTPPKDTAARIRALIALYRESHYDVRLPNGRTATLRIGEPAPVPVARWIGDDDIAFYVTSCNPYSSSLPKAENDERLELLREELRATRYRWLEGAGHVPGEAWRENCLLVSGIGGEEADAIARRYDQNSIVVVPSKAAVKLRIYRPEWHGIVGDGTDLEWP
jgi:hypothetical protein